MDSRFRGNDENEAGNDGSQPVPTLEHGSQRFCDTHALWECIPHLKSRLYSVR
ncbi:hypothetical protein [Endozoicomonas sp. ALB122]|uniref:hypothetical protein n=1 Tax=Endozoicomonas sp. ALB122 TaxID=3403075 RepID=UPI003BB7F562